MCSKNILIIDAGLTHTMWEASVFWQMENQSVVRCLTGRYALDYICRKWKPDLIAVGAPADMSATEYAVINNWNHGFAIVDVNSAGTFQFRNYRVMDGEVFAA